MSDEANFTSAPTETADMNIAESNSEGSAGDKATTNGKMTGGANDSNREGVLRPPVDVIEDASGITLFADMPGVAKEKLSVQFEADTLTIEGQISLNVPQEMQSHFADIAVQRYQRSFTLSKELDTERTSAEFKNGVLRLHIPKAQQAQPRKIQVNVT